MLKGSSKKSELSRARYNSLGDARKNNFFCFCLYWTTGWKFMDKPDKRREIFLKDIILQNTIPRVLIKQSKLLLFLA